LTHIVAIHIFFAVLEFTVEWHIILYIHVYIVIFLIYYLYQLS
jgi:hypothetical protein